MRCVHGTCMNYGAAPTVRCVHGACLHHEAAGTKGAAAQ
jgi:hypothetical protein